MKITELTPGLYKLRKKVYGGGRRSRSGNLDAHILRVTGYGDKLRYFLDHDQFGAHPRDMVDLTEDYEVVAKIDNAPTINKCKITLSFTDSAGDEYNWSVVNAWILRDVFEANPWLKEPFGFEPRKKNK